MSRYDDLKLQILYSIYEDAFREGSPETFLMENLGLVLPRQFILGITRAIISELKLENYLNYFPDSEYSISPGGIRYIEIELDDPNSRLCQLLRQREQPADSANVGVTIPASDRVVALDHNGDPYKGAIAALDAALKEFKNDRLLDNEWGPEKSALVRTIEAGRELFEQGEVRAATIFATIVTPLRVVRDRYDHAIVAGLVTAGADQLVGALGHAITLVLRLIGMA